jgi:hypothetical protein
MEFSENSNNYSDDYINSSIKGDVISLPEGPKYSEDGKKLDEPATPLEGKQSMLHSLSVLHYNDFNKQGNSQGSVENTPERFYNDKNPTGYKNPSGSNIVYAFDENYVKHAMQYKWGDFLFLDNYGKIPNNHLITLRRFAQPSNDNLLNNLENPGRDVSRLLTYMDGEDNTFDSVFSFSTGFNWKEFQSEIQTIEKSKTGWGGLDFLGYADTSGKFAQEKLQGKAQTNFDPYTAHQNNYVWGPIDVIDKVITRNRGINFTQDMSLKFRYSVRSYDGINTKVAFLDIIGNILNMVTNKAPFWGGSIRFTGGGGHSGPLGDAKALRNGDVDGFLSSMIKGIGNKLEKPFANGFMEGMKNIAGNVGASLLGGQLDKLGRPEMHSLHSLLTAQPTGEWHLTVGNPFNPAMMVGNLIMEDAKIGFEGPFTIDDIPSFVTVEIKLKHAMPRDKYGIQRMFNFGGTRFYGADIDYQNKAYYRNRGNSTGKGSLKTPAEISTNTVNATSDGKTKNTILSYIDLNRYNSKEPAKSIT